VTNLDPTTRRSVPVGVLVAVGVAVLALLALAVVQLVLRADHRSLRSSGDAGLQGLSKDEQSAVNAAKQETINIQTYRQKSFDADFAAAVAGMTPAKATEWQARKTELKSGLLKIKQDSAATVSGAGLVTFAGSSAVVLVSSDSQRIDAKGTSTTFSQNRFQVTMKLTNGKWLMDDLQAVALS
jgi:Tfp pilus assembly protein PilV